MAAVFERKKKKEGKEKEEVLEQAGRLAVRGRAVLSAILLTLHEGQLPANQLPSRTGRVGPRPWKRRRRRGETGRQYKASGLFPSTVTAAALACQTVAPSREAPGPNRPPHVAGHSGGDLPPSLSKLVVINSRVNVVG